MTEAQATSLLIFFLTQIIFITLLISIISTFCFLLFLLPLRQVERELIFQKNSGVSPLCLICVSLLQFEKKQTLNIKAKGKWIKVFIIPSMKRLTERYWDLQYAPVLRNQLVYDNMVLGIVLKRRY